jgi:hypothetical protein
VGRDSLLTPCHSPPRIEKPGNESDFFSKFIFFKKNGLPVLPTGLPVLADFNHYRPTGLTVIPIGKPVIPIGLPILDFSNAKFEFGAVVVVTGHTGGERFSRPYRFFNPCSPQQA